MSSKGKLILILTFVMLFLYWTVFTTYCIANEEYAAALISLSTMVIILAMVVPVVMKK